MTDEVKTTTVLTAYGVRTVDVHAQAGGLAVTAAPDTPDKWHVTHLRSGRTVARFFATPETAGEAMRALGALGNWDRTYRVVMRDKRLCAAALELRQRLGAGEAYAP